MSVLNYPLTNGQIELMKLSELKCLKKSCLNKKSFWLSFMLIK